MQCCNCRCSRAPACLSGRGGPPDPYTRLLAASPAARGAGLLHVNALHRLLDALQQSLAFGGIAPLPVAVHVRERVDVRFEILLTDGPLKEDRTHGIRHVTQAAGKRGASPRGAPGGAQGGRRLLALHSVDGVSATPAVWGQLAPTPGGGLAARLGPSQLHASPERGSRPPSQARARHGDLVCRSGVWARPEQGFARPEASPDSPGPGFQGCEAGRGAPSCLAGTVLFRPQTPLSISPSRSGLGSSPLSVFPGGTRDSQGPVCSPRPLCLRVAPPVPNVVAQTEQPSRRGNCPSGRNERPGDCRSATSWARISQLFGNVPYLLHKRPGRRDL